MTDRDTLARTLAALSCMRRSGESKRVLAKRDADIASLEAKLAALEHAPQVSNIQGHPGIAGQLSVTAEVTYPDEPTETITFVGSVYGGPVVMLTPDGTQTIVSDPSRFGEFGPQWVQRFYS